ncbi:MAG: hypothetical protein OHK0057_28680 [Thermoflexibacter sp.]
MKKIHSFILLICTCLSYAQAQKIDDKIEVITSGFYTHFTGKLNNQPITADLMNHENQYVGTYYYNTNGRPFQLKEIKSNSTKHILEELDTNGHITGIFEGVITKKSFIGVRETEQGKRKVPVELKEDYTKGSMQFIQYYINNSKDTTAPFDTKVHFLYPSQFPDTKVLEAVRSDLGKGTFKLPMPNNLNIEVFKNQVVEKLHKHYSYLLDGAAEREFIDIDMLVYLNENYLLSIRINEVVDADGEEIDEQKFYTWDLKTGKLIHLDDIFKADYKEELRKIILQAIIKSIDKENLQEAQSNKLDKSMIDFDFYMTTGGMTFFYLLPDSDNDLEIYIPFKEMLSILKAESPISHLFRK